MTLTNFQKNFFTIIIATVGVALIIMFWPKSCGRPIQPQPTVKVKETPEYKNLLDTLKTRDNTIDAVLDYSKGLVQDLREKDSLLKIEQAKNSILAKRTNNLANEVISARTNKDTARYIRSCDSLAYINQRLGSRIETEQHACNMSLKSRDNLLANKDRTISLLQSQTKGYEAAIHLLQATQAIENKPPLIVGYLGVEVDFAGEHLIDGFGPKCLLIFRNGTGVSGAVKFLNGYRTFEAAAYKSISFKRH